MNLPDCFDAVIMLTWSDWQTEPRSNRYHYATRFSRHFPVLFVQNQRSISRAPEITANVLPNLDLINVSAPIQLNEIEAILGIIRGRGIKRPLIWIYDSLNYHGLLLAMPKWFRVYHATEDYFTQSAGMQTTSAISESVEKLVLEVDLIVAVSERVLASIEESCMYSGASLVAENGCDFEFFAKLGESLSVSDCQQEHVVIYQGGVNNRLDYGLIQSVAALLPDSKFRFIGRVVESDGLNRLRKLDNVEILGEMSPEDLGREMYLASVAVIPFIQDKWIKNSFPLKSFEYIACGLPVVSVPIDALMKYEAFGGVIKIASAAADFADAIRSLGALRKDPVSLRKRLDLARENSYDRRFESVVDKLRTLGEQARASISPLNLALLYDPASCYVGTVKEHLKAFELYSSHNVTFIPAANLWNARSQIEAGGAVDFSVFDVAVIHYSVRLSLPQHLNENFSAALEAWGGLKVLFIQDEYDSVECARAWMDRLRFDLVYTCVPLDQKENVYPAYRYPATDFLPTLTGYVPESPGIERFATPTEKRRIAIAYRARELPAIYGQLGHEKYVIGTEVKRRSVAIGLQVDISWDEESRIYGDAWYEFLGSARGTLGTESGSNVFDFDGSLSSNISRLKEKDPTIAFNEIWESALKEHDGKIRMNQISPKIFEAIRLRTALILFEGEYSGVVKPNLHYFPLKKDFSNFEEVVDNLMDDELVREVTNRAYEDVITSGKYSYKQFVDGFDADLRVSCLRRGRRRLMYGPVYAMNDVGELRQCLPAIPLKLTFAADVLDGQEPFQVIQQKLLLAMVRSGRLGFGNEEKSTIIGPETDDKALTVRGKVFAQGKKLVLRYGTPLARKIHALVSLHPITSRLARAIYFNTPAGVKSWINRIFKGS